MTNHVLFFTYLPLTQKREEDFYMQELIRYGYKVTYVDLSAIYSKHAANIISEERSYVVKVKSIPAFESIIKSVAEEPHTLVIPIVTYNYQVLRLFKIASKYKVRLGYFGRGMIPTPALQTTLMQRVIADLRSYLSVKRLFIFLQNKLAFYYKASGKVKTYDVIFAAGQHGILTVGTGNELDLKAAQIVNINYFDYDKYLTLEKEDTPLVTYKYAVFIDQCLPYHPDVKLFGLKEIDPDKYFRSLNNFFDEIESRFQLKVVIAAHPKADYNNSPYGNREIFKYKTAELVKFSAFALTHNSTSLSFAILYNKPIFILSNSGVEELFSRRQLQFLADFVGGYFADTDHPGEVAQLPSLQISKEKYEHYKYSFLTSEESERQKTADIFLNYLAKGEN